jgi:acyl-CoA thioesterase FadM
MGRVEVPLPDVFPFRTEIPIRIGDLNYGNHLGNDAVLAIAQEARARFLRGYGWSELAVEGGVGILVVDAAIVYRAQGRYGMTLRVELAFAHVRSRGCDVLYRLTDAASAEVIARVKTGVVFFDHAAQKVARMPEAFRDVIGAGCWPAAPTS